MIHCRQPLVLWQPLSCSFGNLWVVYHAAHPAELRGSAGCSSLPEDGVAVFWAAEQVAVVRLKHPVSRVTDDFNPSAVGGCHHHLSARNEPFRILLID